MSRGYEEQEVGEGKVMGIKMRKYRQWWDVSASKIIQFGARTRY